MHDILKIKQRFGVIGNSYGLNRALDIAFQVAPTDLSVLIAGESGVGKEIFPQIIHQFSARKHGAYIAVNCGAIPDGTIDSELFGHEKGSFTGAHEKRRGYFEVANEGTIFLDEIGEMPIETQARLLRVLESGEFLKVGSSAAQKTNVRVIAATNVNVPKAIKEGKFREDLYYRLNTVPITIPPLRERREDIYLLFRKFANDFAEKYRMPVIRLSPEAQVLLEGYHWPGNIRQLKNVTEQISVIEQERDVTAAIIRNYLPNVDADNLPVLYNKSSEDKTFASEREILYKILFDMKEDMNHLKTLVREVLQKEGTSFNAHSDNAQIIRKLYTESEYGDFPSSPSSHLSGQGSVAYDRKENMDIQDTEEIVEESLSLEDKEIELIQKALEKHHGRRKAAAEELGISERTLYRKIKEYDIS